LQKTRRDLHLKVAETIETLFAERLADVSGMLAYHFSRAEHLEKAEHYLFQAGDEAARAAASAEALDYFREASRLYLLIHGEGGRPNDRELFQVRYNRARAQVATDARRYFFDTVGSIRRLSETDPTAIDQACGMYAGAAAVFAFAGASFAIGRRFLAIARRLV